MSAITAEHKVEILQRFVDSYPDDLRAIQEALADPEVPAPARRVLVGGMNYSLDMLDMFPDHFKGIGIADDAIILRLAARQAVTAGAAHPTLKDLAAQATDVATVFSELVGPLDQLVAKLPDRSVRGRTADRILEHKDTRISFEADIAREAKRHNPQPIEMEGGAERAIIELRKMVTHGLKKAGITSQGSESS
jgi:uncharacterized membrane protein YkvA (DUF1232 family)